MNGGTDWSKGINLTIIYPRSYDYNLSVIAIASIGDYTTDYLSDGIFLFLEAIQIQKSSLIITIISDNANKIQKLTSSYLLYLSEPLG